MICVYAWYLRLLYWPLPELWASPPGWLFDEAHVWFVEDMTDRNPMNMEEVTFP